MEDTGPAAGDVTKGRQGDQEADNTVLMSSKPLHRFIQLEPKSLGIVILICGCTEILMGFHLAGETTMTSYRIYVPFWEGALFLISGNLSIYTERHPSKKMVTVSLAMYLVSFFGILVSFGYRMACFSDMTHFWYTRQWEYDEWIVYRAEQLVAVEIVLVVISVCVSVILIFLTCVARLALKSTRTQVIVQCVPAAPQRDTTTN